MTSNRVMVITGASSGLGKCLCQSFSKSYKVINISRSLAVSEYNIITNLNDLSDLKQKLHFNKIKHNLCVLNAGTLGSIGRAPQISHEEFLEAFTSENAMGEDGYLTDIGLVALSDDNASDIRSRVANLEIIK